MTKGESICKERAVAKEEIVIRETGWLLAPEAL
jgi:hypothetical protein